MVSMERSTFHPPSRGDLAWRMKFEEGLGDFIFLPLRFAPVAATENRRPLTGSPVCNEPNYRKN